MLCKSRPECVWDATYVATLFFLLESFRDWYCVYHRGEEAENRVQNHELLYVPSCPHSLTLTEVFFSPTLSSPMRYVNP